MISDAGHPQQQGHTSEGVLEAERRGCDSLQLGLVGRTSLVGIPVSLFITFRVRHAYSRLRLRLLPSTVGFATALTRSSSFPLLLIPPMRLR